MSCLFGTSWCELRISSRLSKTVSVVLIFSLSLFLTSCMGLRSSDYTDSNCASIDPCESNPCAADEKYV